MSSPVYLGPATILASGQEFPVEVELTGDVPVVGLPSWTGALYTADARFATATLRRGRLRLPGGWEGGFAVMRTILGVSTVWVRGNDLEASPADWPA
ncbi:hypothetical protein ACGFX4_39145 [Kitasatospora sp. NPDC048365]|uniref:hypothetical protein n=1 Tax=Kitasatospora sp. NPDC048365 TaxID=3364050 RepID=UPI00371AEA7B